MFATILSWLARASPYALLPAPLHAPWDAAQLLLFSWFTWASFAGLYTRFASFDLAHLLHTALALAAPLAAAALCVPARAVLASGAPWLWAAYFPYLAAALLLLRLATAAVYARLALHDVGRAFALTQVAAELTVCAPLAAALALPASQWLPRAALFALATGLAAVAALAPALLTPKRWFLHPNAARLAERYGQLTVLFLASLVVASLVTVPATVVRAAAASNGIESLDLAAPAVKSVAAKTAANAAADTLAGAAAGAAFALPLGTAVPNANGAAPLLAAVGDSAISYSGGSSDPKTRAALATAAAAAAAGPVLLTSAGALVRALAPVVGAICVLMLAVLYLYVQVDAASEHDKHALARRGRPALVWAAAHPLLVGGVVGVGSALFDLAPLLAAPAGSEMLRAVTAATALDAAAVAAAQHFTPLSPRQLLAASLLAVLAALALLRASHDRATVPALVAAAFPQLTTTADGMSIGNLKSADALYSNGESGYSKNNNNNGDDDSDDDSDEDGDYGRGSGLAASSNNSGGGSGGYDTFYTARANDSHAGALAASRSALRRGAAGRPWWRRAARRVRRALCCGGARAARARGGVVCMRTWCGRPLFLVALAAARVAVVAAVVALLLASAWTTDAAAAAAAAGADAGADAAAAAGRTEALVVVALAVLAPVLVAVASLGEDRAALWCFKRSVTAVARAEQQLDASFDDGSGVGFAGGGALGASPLGPQPSRAGYFSY